MYDFEDFIKKNIILRENSLFETDISNHKDSISEKISGKKALVIGGAGSIGSAFAVELLKYEPAELCVVDTNENALTELTRWILSEGMKMPKKYRSYPMDYNSPSFRRMFCDNKGFDIVANFSAHKHVRSEKDIFSVEAMLRNNVINALGLLELLQEHKPELYFCVSTDKAANPVNIMGASKRLMEDLIFSYSDSFDVKTARFANVAFSNGSLLDGFVHRINNKQPLSAPMDVKRYFVSQREAGQICLMAAVLGNNREIFFPKLDEEQMMSFDTIALRMLEYYGYEPVQCDSENEAIKYAKGLSKEDKHYPVYFSKSDTSGEKPFEEFYTENEQVELDRFHSLGVVKKSNENRKDEIKRLIKDLDALFEKEQTEKEDVVRLIKGYLPNFEHIETGKSLDSKM